MMLRTRPSLSLVLLLLLLAGLAIPASVAAEAAEPCDCELAACLVSMVEEHRRRGWIGAGLAGTGGAEGLRVADVAPHGPADRAGLVPGDRVVAIDGESFGIGAAAFYTRMAKVRPGQQVRLTVQPQEGERKVVPITAAEFPPELLQRSIGLHVLNLVHEHTAPEHQVHRSGGAP